MATIDVARQYDTMYDGDERYNGDNQYNKYDGGETMMTYQYNGDDMTATI
eukprot:CAMPEP_0172478856 /NCGR_PEP_ID=MMETSP1066-20121228/3074_1 /TAXON_ID=671091 /ORGANISM="Coscinodiscus wailesii, Strain CCMP2513" /LENGTH=49 /DNA_ID=CAMNT_0013238767 /DNA_START=384 /DNA_END=533 /DNA_ORIENTATION=-